MSHTISMHHYFSILFLLATFFMFAFSVVCVPSFPSIADDYYRNYMCAFIRQIYDSLPFSSHISHTSRIPDHNI